MTVSKAVTLNEKSMRRELRSLQRAIFMMRNALAHADDMGTEDRARIEAEIAICVRGETYLIHALSNLPQDTMACALHLQAAWDAVAQIVLPGGL